MHEHYFVACFDLKNFMYNLIDNTNSDQSIFDRYGHMPIILRNVFTKYLDHEQHPNANRMKTVMPKRMVMSWRTKDNHVDCGVFMMRHMETYKGPVKPEWECGLVREGQEQKKQLNDLRIKYLSKILLSNMNTGRQMIMDEVSDYAKHKEKLQEFNYTTATERIRKRVMEVFNLSV